VRDQDVTVRQAAPDEHAAAMGVLDAAVLEVDAGAVLERIPEDVLVAVEDDRVLGALVLAGDEVEAVAVRPGRRGQGVGSALVEAAAERRGRIVAEFDDGVRPFYEALGFEVESGGNGRCRGVRLAARR